MSANYDQISSSNLVGTTHVSDQFISLREPSGRFVHQSSFFITINFE